MVTATPIVFPAPIAYLASMRGYNSQAFFALAISLGLAVLGLPETYRWLAPWCVLGAIFCLLICLVLFLQPELPAKLKGERFLSGPFLIMASGIVIFLCGLAWQSWPKSGPQTRQNDGVPEIHDDLPDVTMEFRSHKNPAVVFTNNSAVVAQNVLWSVVLWNLDDPRSFSGKDNGPDAHEPLQIPTAKIDFIRPGVTAGPFDVFGQNVLPFVHKGQTLIGSASAVCPNCVRGHTYLVYIKIGEGGWYAHYDAAINGEVMLPDPMTKSGVARYIRKIFEEAKNLKKIEF